MIKAMVALLAAVLLGGCVGSADPRQPGSGGAPVRGEREVIDSSRSPQSGTTFGIPWSAVDKAGKRIGVSCPLLVNVSKVSIAFSGVEPMGYDRKVFKFIGFRLVETPPGKVRVIDTAGELGSGDDGDFLKRRDHSQGAVIVPESQKQSRLYPVLMFEVVSPRKTEVEGCRLLFSQGGEAFFQNLPLHAVFG